MPVYASHQIAVVEVVEGHATLQRTDLQKELTEQMSLQSGDVITTEKDTRVWITFQDDSMLKLGEESRIALDRLAPATEETAFAATFSMMTGVFRFFTQTETERDIQINIANSVTLGVRGTDLFVGSTPEKDWICLVKGVIQLQADEKTVELNQPRQFFVIPKGKSPLPIQFVSDEKFSSWVKSTELLTKE